MSEVPLGEGFCEGELCCCQSAGSLIPVKILEEKYPNLKRKSFFMGVFMFFFSPSRFGLLGPKARAVVALFVKNRSRSVCRVRIHPQSIVHSAVECQDWVVWRGLVRW